MRMDILSLFPEMFNGPFGTSILKRGQEKGLLNINLINIRDFSQNKHRTVDDTPYGGGAGMVIGVEPVHEALQWLEKTGPGQPGRIILMSPAGHVFNQSWARSLAREKHIVLICGHYEGIDERVRENFVTDELSVGDFVLTGGELPAMLVVDAVARLIPGVLGEEMSPVEESFGENLLEYPHYTRPRDYRGYPVPEVLLSGHHEKIRLWRRRQSLIKTIVNRPDLLEDSPLTAEDKKILQEICDSLKSVLEKT